MTNPGLLHIFLFQILQENLAHGNTLHATVTLFVWLTWLFIYVSPLSLKSHRQQCLTSSHRFCLSSVHRVKLSLFLSVPFAHSFLHAFVNLITPFHSQYNVTSWIFVIRFILQSRGVMMCFSLINVCLANTLIISTRANRIDNYTLYTEALSLILFVFPSFPPTASSIQFHLSSLSPSFSSPLCVVSFSESNVVFFHS